MMDCLTTPIFVVDDDRELSVMIEGILHNAGFKSVLIANSAKEALEALSFPSTVSPDTKTLVAHDDAVVILDVVLPDMNGFELSRKIKETHPDSIVLMISGFDIEELNAKLIDSYADDFLTKPFSPAELVARIRLLTERRDKRKPSPVAVASQQEASLAGNRIPHIGDRIGDFLILDSLGWGKNSVIYKVASKAADGIFALKLLTKYSMEFKDVVSRFKTEMLVMSRLKHPNIVRFHGDGSWDGCPYIVMEYIYGINLEEQLVVSGLPPPYSAISTALQAASGIDAMHRSGVIHRDIKLKNIMLEPDTGLVKLADFGIAKIMDSSSTITQDGFIIGTPIYMPPEIFRGEMPCTESGIYSFGVTIYHYAAGSPPFSSAKNSELYKKHLNETPRPLREFNHDVPMEFDKLICQRCMAKKPQDRPSSMSEIVAALDSIKTHMDSGHIR